MKPRPPPRVRISEPETRDGDIYDLKITVAKLMTQMQQTQEVNRSLAIQMSQQTKMIKEMKEEMSKREATIMRFRRIEPSSPLNSPSSTSPPIMEIPTPNSSSSPTSPPTNRLAAKVQRNIEAEKGRWEQNLQKYEEKYPIRESSARIRMPTSIFTKKINKNRASYSISEGIKSKEDAHSPDHEINHDQ